MFQSLGTWLQNLAPQFNYVLAGLVAAAAVVYAGKPAMAGMKEIGQQKWGEGMKHMAAIIVLFVIAGLIAAGALQKLGSWFAPQVQQQMPTGTIVFQINYIIDSVKMMF